MAFFEKDELKDLYQSAKDESYEWRRDYKEYERLADNGLIEDLDETLPEVNDGTLSAALFKLPKRIINTDLVGGSSHRTQMKPGSMNWLTCTGRTR